MSAVETALRVIAWTQRPEARPPQGDAAHTGALAYPGADLAQALARLALATGAKLRLGAPPLGDPRPVGCGAGVLAAALGALDHPRLARVLLQAVPDTVSGAEWAARHGLVAAAWPHLPQALRDDFVARSPLTALWFGPAAGRHAEALVVAQRLGEHKAARLALQAHLARPELPAESRGWHTDLLERWRLLDERARAFVLDVYETAFIHHRVRWLERVRAARERLIDPLARERTGLEEALSIAAWWGPLARLERDDPGALRARRFLSYEYREAVALFRLHGRLTGRPS